jgi:hypothetical protein
MASVKIIRMKYIHKLSVRITIAIVVGLLLAFGWTDIQYPCPPLENTGCVAFESAIMHPNDLLNNKQNSLVEASKTFAITSLVTFALLTVISGI